jgi:hypothetical protein
VYLLPELASLAADSALSLSFSAFRASMDSKRLKSFEGELDF